MQRQDEKPKLKAAAEEPKQKGPKSLLSQVPDLAQARKPVEPRKRRGRWICGCGHPRCPARVPPLHWYDGDGDEYGY